jgi:glycine/D-amino acid oxidase-like deaminating enzyme
MAEPWGGPPWRIEVAIPEGPPPTHVEVAVVGGGFAGLATAWQLARRGLGVAVLEATRIGAGASGRSGAIALEGTAVGLLDDADHCLESLARTVAEARIACGLVLDGCWEVEHRRQGDGPWRDGDAVLCVSDTVPGGTLDAGAVLAGLARAILACGGTIHEGYRVEALEHGTRRMLRSTRGDVLADCVVVATNAYLPTLLALPVDLRPALTLALATAPLDRAALDGLGLRLPFYTADLPYLWGRTLAEGRVVFGSGLVFPPARDVRETRADGEEGQAIFARLEARVRGFHPALARVTIESRWGGPIAFVPSRAPILTPHPDDPRVVVTGGCAGHGVALSFRLAELVAEHLTSGRPLPPWGGLDGP